MNRNLSSFNGDFYTACCFVQVQADRMKVVAEQVRATLKPFFQSGVVDKDAYKEIMRKAVPKVRLSTTQESICLCMCAI